MPNRTKPITITDDEGVEVTLPSKWDICSTCNGNGKHSLAVDGHGITESERERDWDEESWSDYMQGRYDQTCTPCDGTGKVRVVDEDHLSPGLLAQWLQWQQDDSDYRQQCEMERRMGA